MKPDLNPEPQSLLGTSTYCNFQPLLRKMGKPPPRLLETGFLAIFLCSPFHLSSPPSLPVLYLFRWLCFRSRRNGNGGERGTRPRSSPPLHIPCWPPGFRLVLGWSRCAGLVVGQIALVCGITLKHNRYLASVGVLIDVWNVFFTKKRVLEHLNN